MPTDGHERAEAGLTPWLRTLTLSLLWVCLGAQAQGIESVLRPGDLVQGHAKLEAECTKCHVRFERLAQDRLCMECHKEVGQDMRERTGFHGRQKAQACRSCHSDHKGRTARIVELDKQKFDHAQTDYLLRGKHVKTMCTRAHWAPSARIAIPRTIGRKPGSTTTRRALP
jgi:hypothetical protein